MLRVVSLVIASFCIFRGFLLHPLLPDSSCLSSSHSSSCAPFSSSSSWPLIPLQPSLWHNCHIVSYSKSQGLCQDLASCVASHTTQYKTVMDSYIIYLRKFQQTPGTYPRPSTQPPVYGSEILPYLYFGVPGVCSRGLLEFS